MTEHYLIIVGIIILVYGFYKALKLRETLGSGELKEAWDVLSVLIGVFILGYVGYICSRYLFDVPVDPELVTAVVFLLGSVFVAVTARTTYRVFQV